MTTKSLYNFSPEQRQTLRDDLKGYFLDEMDQEIGDLQLDLLLDFLVQQIGKHYYNVGVTDTIQAIRDKAEDLVLLIKE